ncbi:MAG: hypothetical protein ACFCUQ_00160 [Kiloniellales bacterium]
MSSKQLWSSYGVEPDLTEVLSDPLVQLVMRRDGIGQEEVWQAVAQARARLAPSATRSLRIETAA